MWRHVVIHLAEFLISLIAAAVQRHQLHSGSYTRDIVPENGLQRNGKDIALWPGADDQLVRRLRDALFQRSQPLSQHREGEVIDDDAVRKLSALIGDRRSQLRELGVTQGLLLCRHACSLRFRHLFD